MLYQSLEILLHPFETMYQRLEMPLQSLELLLQPFEMLLQRLETLLQSPEILLQPFETMSPRPQKQQPLSITAVRKS